MGDVKKVTAFLPAEVLANARIVSGLGVTETLKLALDEYLYGEWCRRMLSLEGKVSIDLDLSELREDRDVDFGADGTP